MRRIRSGLGLKTQEDCYRHTESKDRVCERPRHERGPRSLRSSERRRKI